MEAAAEASISAGLAFRHDVREQKQDVAASLLDVSVERSAWHAGVKLSAFSSVRKYVLTTENTSNEC